MLQQRQVGALFAVFVRTIGAARFVCAVAPVAALVAVASIPLPRAASPIEAELPSSGLVRMFDVAQRASHASGDIIASAERRRHPSKVERVDRAGSGVDLGTSSIGDRWLKLRAEQRALQRSGESSARHVGDRLLHADSSQAVDRGSVVLTREAFALLSEAVKPVASTNVESRAPPIEAAQVKDSRGPAAASADDVTQAARSADERSDFAAASRLAAVSGPAIAAGANPEHPAAERDTLSPLKLSPEQRNISRFVARRYRVSLDDVQRFVAHAFRAAGEFRIDPYLVLAVMSIESSFNPNARSSAGAQGLMQVLTRVHLDKFAPFGGARAALDPVANITVGSRILKEYLVREGSVEGALKSYVGAALLPHDFGYGNKVLTERARIAAAARDGATPPQATTSTKIAMAERQAGVPKASAMGTEVAGSRQSYSAMRVVSGLRAREEL